MTKVTTIFEAATASKVSRKNRELVRDVKKKVRDFSDKKDKVNYDIEVMEEAVVDLMTNPSSSIDDVITLKRKLASLNDDLKDLEALSGFYKMPTDDEISSLDKKN